MDYNSGGISHNLLEQEEGIERLINEVNHITGEIMGTLRYFGIMLVIVTVLVAMVRATPDPGHDAVSVGPGIFPVGNFTFRNNVTIMEDLYVRNIFAYMSWQYILSPPWLNLTDQRFNESSRVDSLNLTKVNIGASNQVKITYQNITNFPTCSAGNVLTFDGSALSCTPDQVGAPGTTDGNNYTISIGISGTTTKTINLARDGMTNISASWTDIDTSNTTDQMFNAANNSALSLGNAYGYPEIDPKIQLLTPTQWCLANSTGTGIICNTTHVDSDTYTSSIAFTNLGANLTLTLGRYMSSSLSTTIAWPTENNPTSYPAANITAGTFPAGNFVLQGNITANTLKFTTAPTVNMIYDNSTCVIIKGATATLNIC
jgi:hypothetical protein